MSTITASNIEKVQVEMSSNLLTLLLNSGLLHCGDCKSLNAQAKKVLWHNLLANSIKNEDCKGDKELCA